MSWAFARIGVHRPPLRFPYLVFSIRSYLPLDFNRNSKNFKFQIFKFQFQTKREVWLLRTGFGIAPVNKLVSLTWLLWALKSFRSFTLHYITIVFLLYGRRITIHWVDPSLTHFLGEFPGLGLALVPHVVGPEVGQQRD